jgi:alpha-D-ribose 1-methylphosphonate 5-triphosphate synthase subunit PhnG
MEHAVSVDRQDWVRILSVSQWLDLKAVSGGISDTAHTLMRGPEIGLIMLRGRMGGSGAVFNVGEATITRCSVKLDDGFEGHSYVLGRNTEHAHIAAICDGLLQQPLRQKQLQTEVIEPLRQKITARRLLSSQKTAATKVDFFTLVRGDG